MQGAPCAETTVVQETPFAGVTEVTILGIVGKTEPVRVWTVAEAEDRLSEILGLAEEEGPQRIGRFVVVPAAVWEERVSPRKPLGQWLLENMPQGAEFELPDRSSNRPMPFVDDEDRG